MGTVSTTTKSTITKILEILSTALLPCFYDPMDHYDLSVNFFL